jgi:hypothetical protein
MNTPKIPGFNAERALLRSAGLHRAVLPAGISSGVVEAQAILSMMRFGDIILHNGAGGVGIVAVPLTAKECLGLGCTLELHSSCISGVKCTSQDKQRAICVDAL